MMQCLNLFYSAQYVRNKAEKIMFKIKTKTVLRTFQFNI